jgi:uncharacterized HhH-GPD family protein
MTTTSSTRKLPILEWTDDAEANRLIAEDPLALLIGFVLDQQVPIEWAFLGPKVMRERLGTLDAVQLARIDPATFETAFRTPPAIHRFPASMAERVHKLTQIVADEYDGDAATLWKDAGDGEELRKRLQKLPGFGEMKSRIVVGVLAHHFGVTPKGWQKAAPDWPTLAGVSTREQRQDYQAKKRAWKASMRAKND